MPITLLATEVPLPMAPSGVAQPNGSISLTSDTVSPGASYISGPVTNNGLRLDLIARWGAGFYAPVSGLALSDGADLFAQVSSGAALIDGLVFVAAAALVALTPSVRNHVWILRDGSLDARVNLTPPSMPGAYLGSVLTDGSGVLSIDSAGRFGMSGGLPLRLTDDEGEPADTPDGALTFLTRTAKGGLYLWDGARHACLFPAVNVETLTGDKALAIESAEVHKLTPSGAHRSVVVPLLARADKGFLIFNMATVGSYDVLIKATAGGATLATLTNGQRCTVLPAFGGAAGSGGLYSLIGP